MIENETSDTWGNLKRDLLAWMAGQHRTQHGVRTQTSTLTNSVKSVLDALRIKPPKRFLDIPKPTYASPSGSEVVAIDLDALSVSPGRRVGSLLPLQALWQELEFDRVLSEFSAGRRFSFSAANVIKAIVLAYALVRLIEDRLDAANVDLNANEALQQLDSIHDVTIHLGSTHVERTSTPTPEQAAILRALKAEPATKTRAL